MREDVKAIHNHFKALPQNKRYMGPLCIWESCPMAALMNVEKFSIKQVTYVTGSRIVVLLLGLNPVKTQ